MKIYMRHDDPGSAPPSGRSSPVVGKSKSVSGKLSYKCVNDGCNTRLSNHAV